MLIYTARQQCLYKGLECGEASVTTDIRVNPYYSICILQMDIVVLLLFQETEYGFIVYMSYKLSARRLFNMKSSSFLLVRDTG